MSDHRCPVLSFAALLFALASFAVAAAEIRVLSSAGSALAQQSMAADFAAQTGHKVTFTIGPPGVVQQRLDAGEACDVIVMASARIDALEKGGRLLAGSRRPLARTGIGVAAREDAPRLDLSTVESTRQAMLAARSISYSYSDTGGTSGANSQRVLANLGIADAVRTKLVPVQNDKGQAMIASGEIELGLYNYSEIPRARGVVRFGPLPAAVQVYSAYDIAVPLTNTSPGPALAYRDFVTDPARRARWEAAGLEQAAPGKGVDDWK